MHWHETFELLSDTQMLLCCVVDIIGRAIETAQFNNQTNIRIAVELDELLISLVELIEQYQSSEYRNTYLSSKLRFFIFNIFKSIVIACAQSPHWLTNCPEFCWQTIYDIFFLNNSITCEIDRLNRRFN